MRVAKNSAHKMRSEWVVGTMNPRKANASAKTGKPFLPRHQDRTPSLTGRHHLPEGMAVHLCSYADRLRVPVERLAQKMPPEATFCLMLSRPACPHILTRPGANAAFLLFFCFLNLQTQKPEKDSLSQERLSPKRLPTQKMPGNRG
jgi:hypothetical protein